MKVHKVTLSIIDFDEVGPEEIKVILENTKYPNRCISPDVKKIETRDIGEWSDYHPLNNAADCDAFFDDLFWMEQPDEDQ